MLIYIETTAKIIHLEINDNSTIETIIRQIPHLKTVPLDQIRIMFEGIQLENYRTLNFYKIQKESTLRVFFRLKGD
jgi:hypothetical protein